jgi:hypothetical protein
VRARVAIGDESFTVTSALVSAAPDESVTTPVIFPLWKPVRLQCPKTKLRVRRFRQMEVQTCRNEQLAQMESTRHPLLVHGSAEPSLM